MSDFYEAPLLAPRQAGHWARGAVGLDDKIVAEIRADAVLGIVQARLDGKSHVRFVHGVVDKGDIRALVSFQAVAVGGPVVDVGSGAILALLFVSLVRPAGSDEAGHAVHVYLAP